MSGSVDPCADVADWDEDTWTTFVTTARPELLRRARRSFRLTEADAEDVVQEVLAKLFAHRHALRPDTNLIAYAHTTLTHTRIDEYRRSKKMLCEPVAELDTVAGVAPSAEADVERRFEEDAVTNWTEAFSPAVVAALASLRPETRVMLIRAYVNKELGADLATAFGLNENTAKSHLLRGKEIVRNTLGAGAAAAENARPEETPVELPAARRRGTAPQSAVRRVPTAPTGRTSRRAAAANR